MDTAEDDGDRRDFVGGGIAPRMLSKLREPVCLSKTSNPEISMM
jgi:hypothetical protein